MKKTLYLVLAGALMLSTVSCGQQGTTNSNEGNVVDTEQKTEDTNTNVEADKYDSLYDAFLNGEATLSTDYYLNNASELVQATRTISFQLSLAMNLHFQKW